MNCDPCGGGGSDHGGGDSFHHGALISADLGFGHDGLNLNADIAGLDVDANVGLDVGHVVADAGHLVGGALDLGLFDCHCA